MPTTNGSRAFGWLFSSQAGQAIIMALLWAFAFVYAAGELRAELAGLRADVQRIESRLDDFLRRPY